MKPLLAMKAGLLLGLVGSGLLISSPEAQASSCRSPVRIQISSSRWDNEWRVGRHHRHGRWGQYRGYHHRPIRYTKVIKVVDDTVVVNVMNDNGSYTPVTLRRVGGTFIGPKGEHYFTMPTPAQLKAVYGLE